MKHVLCFLVILAMFACMYAMPADGDKKDPPSPPKPHTGVMNDFENAATDYAKLAKDFFMGNW